MNTWLQSWAFVNSCVNCFIYAATSKYVNLYFHIYEFPNMYTLCRCFKVVKGIVFQQFYILDNLTRNSEDYYAVRLHQKWKENMIHPKMYQYFY